MKKQLCIFATFLCVSFVVADDNPKSHREKSPKQQFSGVDINKDGAITFAEFVSISEARLQKRYNKMDQNGDGKISAEEFDSAKEKRQERRQNKQRQKQSRQGPERQNQQRNGNGQQSREKLQLFRQCVQGLRDGLLQPQDQSGERNQRGRGFGRQRNRQ